MNITYRPAKMLICLVGRHKGEFLVEAAKAAGARGGTISFGRTVGDNPILRALALADVQQDIVFTLMGQEADTVIAAIKTAAREHPKKLSGYAAVLPVPRMMVRNMNQENQTPETSNGSTPMIHSGHQLITVITNSGYGDDIMAAARKAGATGGTILNARGTGTEEDVKFFGITLVPDKEMLLIVVKNETTQAIIDAVSSVPKLNEPGGGVVFTMNVEEFMVLGTNA